MAEEYKIKLTADASQVNKEIKETTTDLNKATKEQGLFAAQTAKVSAAFGMLKGGVNKVITSFKTLKGAIAATGIGLIVVAFGALVQYFKDSEEGASKLKEITSALGVVFGNITDIVSNAGKALYNLLTGNVSGFKDAIAEATDQVKNFGEQTKKEVGMAIQLEKERLALQKFEREAIVSKAEAEKEIMLLRLKARDEENFSREERLEFMREANRLADEQLQKDLHVAQEKLRMRQVENSFSKSTQENLDEEARLQAEIFRIQRSNFSERKRMKTEEQSLNKQIIAEEKKREAEKKKEEEAAIKAEEKKQEEIRKAEEAAEKKAQSEADKLLKIQQDNSLLEIEDAQQKANRKLEIEQQRALASIQGMDNEEQMKLAILEKYRILQDQSDAKFSAAEVARKKKQNTDEAKLAEANTMNTLSAASQLAGALQGLAGESKELAIGSAIIDTYVGANKAFAQGGMLGFISAAAVIAGGLANVKTIMETDTGGSGGGAGSSAGAVAGAPLGQMLGQQVSQPTSLDDVVGAVNSQNDQPVQAFVIAGDVTDAQEANTYIKNQSTL